jgi:hypothetical protein
MHTIPGMTRKRHHIPLDSTSHMVMLGGEPEDLTAEHAEGEDPGVTFWAEPGARPQLFRVFARGDFLPAGGAVLVGEARAGHGLRLYLYELPGSRRGAGGVWPRPF